MTSLFLECASEECEWLTSELHESGTLGIVEKEIASDVTSLQAFFASPEEASAFARRFPQYAREQQEEEQTDWVAATQAAWPPMEVGERWFLVPEWFHGEIPAGRTALPIHPGMACGTGYHAATQLCLTAIEKYLRPHDRVLDVGAGSGLLSVAAARLGRQRITACDVDAEVVAIAREHFATDGARVESFVGSADAVRNGAADFLAANISAAVNGGMAAEYRRVLREGGTLVVSGFERYEAAYVQGALAAQGFVLLEMMEQDTWVCLVLHRSQG